MEYPPYEQFLMRHAPGGMAGLNDQSLDNRHLLQAWQNLGLLETLHLGTSFSGMRDMNRDCIWSHYSLPCCPCQMEPGCPVKQEALNPLPSNLAADTECCILFYGVNSSCGGQWLAIREINKEQQRLRCLSHALQLTAFVPAGTLDKGFSRYVPGAGKSRNERNLQHIKETEKRETAWPEAF